MAGVDIEWDVEAVNRRRSQNRIAQRKSRQSRKKAKTLNDNGNQSPLDGGSHSRIEQNSTITCNPSTSVGDASIQTVSVSTTNSPNITSNAAIPEIENVSFIELLSSDSNNSLLAPQITNFQPDFDQILDFMFTNEIPSASPRGLEYLNIYGSYDSAISTNSYENRDAEVGFHAHPALNLVLHNEISANQISPVGYSNKCLRIAARRGHETIVRTLLSHNIDCNEKESDMRTALIHASIDGHECVVSLLLAHGARISDVDRRGRSAIYWATMNQHEAVLRLLLSEYDKRDLEQGIDTYDDMGWTALHIAIEKGFDMGVQLLLGSGANLNAKASKTCNGDDDKGDSRIVQAE
ncbi:hypothetical protein EAF04_008918 [Stromatinia cepivora]|nr:hypothetical protein EAF04_008918 [Stromatinia cepivora]